MIKKSSFKIRLGLIVFSLCFCSLSTIFAQRPLRNLGVTATGIRGCDPIVGCWDPPMSWPLEAIHSAVVPTRDRVNSLAKVLMYDFGTYSAPTTTVSAKLWDPYCTAATPNDPSCFTSVPLLITIAGQSGVTTFCSGHNFLSDGKLLTIGGDHINVQQFGQAKGPVISYAFDPFADLTTPPFGWAQRAFLRTPVICQPGPPPPPTAPPTPPFDCSTSTGPGYNCGLVCLAGGRFYPTGIAMDVQIGAQTFLGQVLAFSGLNINTTAPIGLNHTIERYDPNSGALGTWTIRGVDNPPPNSHIDANQDLYPRMHLFPSSLSGTGPTGSVFYVAYSEPNSSLYNPANDTYTPKAAPSTYREEGTSVLLPLVLDSNGNISNEVRILIAGGCNGRSPNPCTSNTAVNLNTAEVYRTGTPGVPLDRWDAAGTMSEQRQHPNAVLLPDGNVFVVGGEKTSGCNPLAVGGPPKVCPGDSLNQCVPSYTTDLFNPVTNSWLGAPSASRPRQYHSGAVLLEDGRVLVEGGDSDYACLCQGQTTCPTAQLYYPGYWWRGDGPVMGFFPPPNGQIMSYGQQFTIPMVTNGTLISKVVLIRPSAVTHSFNNEQRYLELRIVPGSQTATSLRVYAPANASIIPRGYSMLFVITGTDTNQIPSDAAWVQLQ